MLSENGKAELEAIARNMGATLLLLRVGGDGDTMFPVPGAPQVLEVEVGAQTMGDLVDLVASIARPDNSTALLSIAGHLNQSGVTARQEGPTARRCCATGSRWLSRGISEPGMVSSRSLTTSSASGQASKICCG